MIQEIRRSQKEEKDVDDEDDDDDGDVQDEEGDEGEEEDDFDDDDNEDWVGGNLRRKVRTEKIDRGRPDVIEDGDDSAHRGRLFPTRSEPGAIVDGAQRFDVHSIMSPNQNEAVNKTKEADGRARFQRSLSNATDPGSYATNPADELVRPSPRVTVIRPRAAFFSLHHPSPTHHCSVVNWLIACSFTQSSFTCDEPTYFIHPSARVQID